MKERKAQLHDMVHRKTSELERSLLSSQIVSVPARFEDRIELSSLSAMMSAAGRKAFDYCIRWMDDPGALPGPLLMGKSGTYKTHMLWALAKGFASAFRAKVEMKAKEIRLKGYAAIEAGDLTLSHEFSLNRGDFPSLNLVATDGAQIAHDVRGSVEAKNLDAVIARYRQEGLSPKSSVLFIDDVEVMKLSDWLHEELYRIFDYRYQQKMPTFVATNLSTEELRQHLGDRIARRIMDMTEPFKL